MPLSVGVCNQELNISHGCKTWFFLISVYLKLILSKVYRTKYVSNKILVNTGEKARHTTGCFCLQPALVCETCSFLQGCQDGSSSPVCWKSLDSKYINSNLHVILSSTFVSRHACDGFHQPTVSAA